MIFSENDSILPGSLTEVNVDYNYGYNSSLFGTTDSVLAIGTAFDGPVGTIVPIYSPEHAKYVFGNIYDPDSKKEANLVAGIQDLYERGARTIYGFRISGKPIYKDFQLARESQFKLRISGVCPSNRNKNFYMNYDNTLGVEQIKIYKTADKATIIEKMLGLVENENSVLVNTFNLSGTYGFSDNTSLVELLKVLNEHKQNNVLKFSIVNKEGVDVTLSSVEAKALTISDLMPGLYLLGRDKNNYDTVKNTPISYVEHQIKNGELYKHLVINTDVLMDLPIYGAHQELSKIFNLSIDSSMSFLETSGSLDAIFGKNNIDYEEVDLSKFEIYKRLGCGYAITSFVENRFSKFKNPKETPIGNVNRVLPIQDGFYSMLENFDAKYRVLMCGNYDDSITGKLPKKKAFLEAFPVSKDLDKLIRIESKVSKNDLNCQKDYSLKINQKTSADLIIEQKDIKTEAMPLVSLRQVVTSTDAPELYEDGTLFLEKQSGIGTDYVLKRYSDNTFVELNNSLLKDKYVFCNGKVYKGELVINSSTGTPVTSVIFKEATVLDKFITVEIKEKLYLYENKTSSFSPIGLLTEAIKNVQDKNLIAIEDAYGITNNITVNSAITEWTTLSEFVEMLNEDPVLSYMFNFSIVSKEFEHGYLNELFQFAPLKAFSELSTYKVGDKVTNKSKTYECIKEITVPATFKESDWTEIKTLVVPELTGIKNKDIKYNSNKFIPYRTTDNFGRHLAQHCAVTSFKTNPTHGIIGCNTILNTNLDNITYKSNELCNIKYQLSAKKPNGNDMLNKENMPYLIGHYISVPALMQYIVYDQNNNYRYISNGAGGYAGMVSKLPLDQSSTNQQINIPETMFDLSNFQLKKLTSSGFITVTNSYTKGMVITDGITMGEPTSPFRRLQVTRTTSKVEEIIKSETEPFIGKTNNLTNRNSMYTALKSAFSVLIGKYIEKIDFKLIVNPGDPKLGIINIDYALVPMYEIREIRNRITITE